MNSVLGVVVLTLSLGFQATISPKEESSKGDAGLTGVIFDSVNTSPIDLIIEADVSSKNYRHGIIKAPIIFSTIDASLNRHTPSAQGAIRAPPVA